MIIYAYVLYKYKFWGQKIKHISYLKFWSNGECEMTNTNVIYVTNQSQKVDDLKCKMFRDRISFCIDAETFLKIREVYRFPILSVKIMLALFVRTDKWIFKWKYENVIISRKLNKLSNFSWLQTHFQYCSRIIFRVRPITSVGKV